MPEGARGASPLGQWPHNLSATLACLGCTVGLFNISRFAVLSVQFGANFIIQFLILSAVFGIPLYTFQVCLGQFLAAGAVDMWRISPVFQGVGIALLVAQALIGVYSTVGVSWIFIYFRDSFITKQDRYRWAEPFDLYREDQRPFFNGTTNLEHTVPDYLNGVVLQRHNLAQPENSFGHIKFQVAFNLAVVWMIVFVSLSKGLRSYGKVVYVFSVVPVFGMLVLCTKMLGLMPRDSHHQVFPETEWTEFFINSNCWVAATTEVFMTWGLLGTAAMQIASHNKQKKFLQRDSSLVIVFTISMLLLAAFLANMCVALLLAHGYNYVPSSFERMSTYPFLQSGLLERYQVPLAYQATPVRWMPHASYVMGERVQKPGSLAAQESGYQVLRLATELVPTVLALLGADQVSPFWAVLFYFVLILFGIAQQLAIWHCVITGIMAINAQSLKSWETTITFFSCACGFILGLPMTTELGIFVVYFLDYCVGSGWWLMVLHLLQVGAVLMVRGRPYSGESIASTLFHKTTSCLITWAAPMLTFTWNVILPVILMVVCITVFKKAGSRDLYSWHVSLGYDYWPLWAREVGAMLQLLPLITVPVVAVVQTCRYLSAGPPDIFDRITMLYRPPVDGEDDLHDLSTQVDPRSGSAASGGGGGGSSQEGAVVEDPPPKYTPPPSYTTATGARIAKMLRQSFRRSVRRLQLAVSGVGPAAAAGGGCAAAEAWGPSSEPPRASLSLQGQGAAAPDPAPSPAPPDYAAVLVEISQASLHDVTIVMEDETPAREAAASGSGAGTRPARPVLRAEAFVRPQPAPAPAGHQRADSSHMTAADVANVLRSSVRRPASSSGVGLGAAAARSQSICVAKTRQRHTLGAGAGTGPRPSGASFNAGALDCRTNKCSREATASSAPGPESSDGGGETRQGSSEPSPPPGLGLSPSPSHAPAPVTLEDVSLSDDDGSMV
ncbi:Sodium- and chloride-dependent glycine transporter 2 [Frankliniella fusca]|uniref:Sodium- and chloride-dependent glycine transporter 2 n=1 Tax=Frankliniella fusca TaxID=407009 RepID=A0AAE1HSZ8_9NEOP|nr:Sodium- and chloride-dependent glycine transporter 2 [Frankliniella fusca]